MVLVLRDDGDNCVFSPIMLLLLLCSGQLLCCRLFRDFRPHLQYNISVPDNNIALPMQCSPNNSTLYQCQCFYAFYYFLCNNVHCSFTAHGEVFWMCYFVDLFGKEAHVRCGSPRTIPGPFPKNLFRVGVGSGNNFY